MYPKKTINGNVKTSNVTPNCIPLIMNPSPAMQSSSVVLSVKYIYNVQRFLNFRVH